jgi:putative aldouronate transport system substrate-binding protein
MKGLDWMQTQEAYILMDWGPEKLGAYKMEDGTVVVNDSVFRGPDFLGGSCRRDDQGVGKRFLVVESSR